MTTSSTFGLAVDAAIAVPGLTPAPGERLPARRCRLSLAAEEELEREWPAAEAERVHEEHVEGEPGVARTIDRHPVLGYRLYARHFGLARVSADGTDVRCAVPQMPLWLWQRFLVGRILPIAAVVQGLEAMHASAVAWDDRAVGIVAPSGVGKSSLALHLVLSGATLVTDDVIALEPSDGSFIAFPGPGVIGVRTDQRDALASALAGHGGKLLGEADKAYLEMPRASRPLPLAGLYMLRPAAAGTPVAIEQLRPVDPSSLLSNTFVVWVRTPERLLTHLDTWAQLATSVPCYEVIRPDDVEARALAESIEEHALSRARTVAA
jgi:hypothetical protein